MIFARKVCAIDGGRWKSPNKVKPGLAGQQKRGLFGGVKMRNRIECGKSLIAFGIELAITACGILYILGKFCELVGSL